MKSSRARRIRPRFTEAGISQAERKKDQSFFGSQSESPFFHSPVILQRAVEVTSQTEEDEKVPDLPNFKGTEKTLQVDAKDKRDEKTKQEKKKPDRIVDSEKKEREGMKHS